jgi:hypothetical protein
MALFQKTVEHKYLKQLDAALIHSKYLEFKSYFGNPEIQANIRNSKEEQYQEGFLRELFVKILGYKLNPTSKSFMNPRCRAIASRAIPLCLITMTLSNIPFSPASSAALL